MNKTQFMIDDTNVGSGCPVYFIADIAANHDGDLEKAKDLIYLAAEAGANAAKFQHFKAETIASDLGFRSLGNQLSHQADWRKSVFEVYETASLNEEWTSILKETCDRANITFFTSPYSKQLIDHVDPFLSAYKIGSGDISWIEIIEYIAKKGKPYILASGASSFDDVVRAVDAGLKINPQLCLMQCNTNYTASLENFKFIQLNVLKSYENMFPGLLLGLSDHTPGHTTVLGAVALGAKLIEKHFTHDNNAEGPDHRFSMDCITWKEMVERTRELELALGDGIKKIEQNEKETVILQRRSVYAAKRIEKDAVINSGDLEFLRPCPYNSIKPYEVEKLIGKKSSKAIEKGANIKWNDIVM